MINDAHLKIASIFISNQLQPFVVEAVPVDEHAEWVRWEHSLDFILPIYRDNAFMKYMFYMKQYVFYSGKLFNEVE